MNVNLKKLQLALVAAGAMVALVATGCSKRTENKAQAMAEETREAADASAEAAGSAVKDVGQAATELGRAAGEAAEDAREAGEEAIEKTAEATREAGAAVAESARNAGRAIDAATETFDVKASLLADARVDASRIDVDTDHKTKKVVLKGSVPNAKQKSIAAEIAAAEAPGYSISNKLEVR